MESVRKIALDLLIEYEELNKYVNLSLSSHKTDSITGPDRAFLTALLYTTVEYKLKYDYYIASFAKRSIDDVSRKARNILRLGLCQLLDMDSVSDHVAINETVKLANSKGERAFVNGVLREVQRRKESLPLPDKEKNIVRYLSVKYSFPQPLIKKYMQWLSCEECERLLSSFNSKEKYTDVTVNTRKIGRKELLEKFLSDGVMARESEYSSLTIRIDGGFDPRRAYGYSDGLFFVQDTASALSSLALGIKEKDRVIDVCACPGGKSFTAAILSGEGGEVFSFDLHESKLSLIESGRERLSLDNVKIGVNDATRAKEELFASFDKVICDVPCSGLGVLAKKPDIRYRALDTIDELVPLQYSILRESVKYLKDNGTLVYSTCTLNPSENEGVVKRFLSEHTEYMAEDFSISTLKSKDGMLTLYPHVHNTDGFFIAKIKKKI